jgi:hypothetical protein
MNPVQYGLEATLGRAKVPRPGPLILQRHERFQVALCEQALQEARNCKPFTSPRPPPVEQLEACSDAMHEATLDHGACTDKLLTERLHQICKAIHACADNCDDPTELWGEFLDIAGTIVANLINHRN